MCESSPVFQHETVIAVLAIGVTKSEGFVLDIVSVIFTVAAALIVISNVLEVSGLAVPVPVIVRPLIVPFAVGVPSTTLLEVLKLRPANDEMSPFNA